jgi:hypothetical protein
VLQLQPDEMQAYLRGRGWQLAGPAANPDLLLFEGPGGEDAPTVLVPTHTDQGADVQRVIDLITEVALAEQRYAGDVLTDMLQQGARQANGPPAPPVDSPLPEPHPAEG